MGRKRHHYLMERMEAPRRSDGGLVLGDSGVILMGNRKLVWEGRSVMGVPIPMEDLL
jgi:hypothetical protein